MSRRMQNHFVWIAEKTLVQPAQNLSKQSSGHVVDCELECEDHANKIYKLI